MWPTAILSTLFPSLEWKYSSRKKVIYLTFDDGPMPGITPWVIEMLRQYKASATFFCVGENVKKHGDIYSLLDDGGHSKGNHTMHHVNGWKVSDDLYLEDVKACDAVMKSRLFRPPYGKLRLSQIRKLKNQYRIIMWDVLSRDFDASLSGRKCADRVIRHAGPGSIVVFHDSRKANERIRYALPSTLEYFSSRGYTFECIA
jgi:peptidoglycan-N-acetylglucosamine deacetylase